MWIQKCSLQSDVPASAVQRMVQIHVNHCTKIFSRRVRNKANLLNFVCSRSLGNMWLAFLFLTFIFTTNPFHTPGALSIPWHFTMESMQDELSSWFLQEKLTQQTQPILSKRVSITLPGTGDPESLEKLQISTWTTEAFSFTKLFDPPFLTQLSFPKQPVRSQKVRKKLTLYFFQIYCRYIMEVNSFSSGKKIYLLSTL